LQSLTWAWEQRYSLNLVEEIQARDVTYEEIIVEYSKDLYKQKNDISSI
jgi:hypothetical protein